MVFEIFPLKNGDFSFWRFVCGDFFLKIYSGDWTFEKKFNEDLFIEIFPWKFILRDFSIEVLEIFIQDLFIGDVGSQIVAHTLTETGNGPNRPNTINLRESGLKNWASSDFYNSYWGLGLWPRRLKHINELGFYVRGVRFRWF